MKERSTIRELIKDVHSVDDFVNLINEFGVSEITDFRKFKKREITRYMNPLVVEKSYRTFEIPKKSGKLRTISAPAKKLKTLQKLISMLLNALYNPTESAFGFIPERSIVDNAKEHINKRFVFNIDLKDFFPSIHRGRIIAMLKKEPFFSHENDEIAFLVASCCTFPTPKENEENRFEWILPQGSPASPVITNIIAYRLDKKLLSLSKRLNLTYTRYADDISFSSDRFVFSENGRFMKELFKTIADEGFKINADKTRIATKKYRQEVTGIVVNEKLNIPRRHIKKVRMWLYYIERYGTERASYLYKKEKLACLNDRDETRNIVIPDDIQKGNLKGLKGRHNRRLKTDLQHYLRGMLQYFAMVKGYSDPTVNKLIVRFNNVTYLRPIEPKLNEAAQEIGNLEIFEQELDLTRLEEFLNKKRNE